MVASNFPVALAFTLEYEGGRSDDSRDPGGRTNEGVTQATYDAYRKSHGLQQRDVYIMTTSERDEIYKNGYWNKVTGDSLFSGVDLCVFDYAVNSGPDRALHTYALVGHGKKVGDAIHAICSSRLSFLHALRTWSLFGSGWSKRVAACEVEATRMSGGSFGDAKSRVENSKKSFVLNIMVFIAGVLTLVGRMIYILPWWGIDLVIILGCILVVNIVHRIKVTKVRIDALLESQNKVMKDKEDSLKIAIANMEAASNKLHGDKAE